IADDVERGRQGGIDAPPVSRDAARLAVHQAARAHDLSAERRADRLVAETDAEDRQLARERADRLDANAGFGRRARPGRKHEPIGLQPGDAFDADLVVAEDANILAQFAEILDQ